LHLAAWTDQGFPGLRIDPAGKKDLYFSREMLEARGPRGGLRVDANATTKKPGRNNPSVVQDQEFVAPQELWKIGKDRVAETTFTPIQHQQARRVAAFERLLRNLVRR